MIDPLYSLSGFAVGLLVGMTGVGGGALMTPILIMLFGVHPATAVGNNSIQGKSGADTLIGGAGLDRFIFSAVSDSTVASSDTISDFVHGADLINSSAISGITSVQGLISGATQVNAHSIVWIQSGANTIVYMNNSAAAQDQAAADMKIILTGVTASTLNSGDFFHI